MQIKINVNFRCCTSKAEGEEEREAKVTFNQSLDKVRERSPLDEDEDKMIDSIRISRL